MAPEKVEQPSMHWSSGAATLTLKGMVRERSVRSCSGAVARAVARAVSPREGAPAFARSPRVSRTPGPGPGASLVIVIDLKPRHACSVCRGVIFLAV